MKKRTIALGLRKYNYTELYIFAQEIHDGVQNKAILFPSPVPSLSVFQTSINAMMKAIEAYGDRGSVGGKAERAALLLARDVLRQDIRRYANYVIAAQPDNFQSWLDVGFALKGLPAKTGGMEKVRNLHQFIARNIPQGKVKLKWARPLGAPPATVINYKVFRSADNNFNNAVFIGSSLNKATYIDTPPKAGVLYFYWVMPESTAGEGVLCEHCVGFASPV